MFVLIALRARSPLVQRSHRTILTPSKFTFLILSSHFYVLFNFYYSTGERNGVGHHPFLVINTIQNLRNLKINFYAVRNIYVVTDLQARTVRYRNIGFERS